MNTSASFHVLHVLHVRREKPFDVWHILHCRIERIKHKHFLNLQCKICKTSKGFSRLTCKTCKTLRVFCFSCQTWRHICQNKKWYPLGLPWVPVFAKKKLKVLFVAMLNYYAPSPHMFNVEKWCRQHPHNFQLFFCTLRALVVCVINIGQWGGLGSVHMWRQCSISFFHKHRSQNIFHINFSNCYQGQNATISSWSNARCEGFCICGDVCDWLMLACTYIWNPNAHVWDGSFTQCLLLLPVGLDTVMGA